MKAVQYRRFRHKVVEHFEAMGAARRTEIDRVESALRNGVSVILTGHAGIGKSYVATTLVSRIEPVGRGAHRHAMIKCSSSRDVGRLRELALAPAAESAAGILIVEDAHLLMADDLRALGDVVTGSPRPVLITIDAHQVDAISRESIERSRLITALWSSLGLDRVDLSGVGFGEAASIIDSVSDGVDAVTRARIVIGAAGNPRLVTELTREAMQTAGGYGTSVSSLVVGPITLSARIRDLTRERIEDLSDVDEYALVTLAKVGAIPYVRATRLVGQAPIRSLLRRGLVRHDPDSQEYVTASLLFASAAQAGRDSENPLEAEHTVERILLAELQAGERLSSNECAILATYWMNNPMPSTLMNPLPEMPAETAAKVFARAARRADLWGLPASAETFARRSLALWPTVEATEQLSRALAGQGMHTAAIELLERERLEHTEALADAEFVSWWYMLLASHTFDAERMSVLHKRAKTWNTVDALIAQLDEVQALREQLLASEFQSGHEELVAFAADESHAYAPRLRALAEAIPAYSYLGMPDALETAFDIGRDINHELALLDPSVISSDTRVALAMFLAEVGLAKAVLGQDRAGVARELDGYALRSLLVGNEFDLALINLVSGALSLTAGRNARAEQELARAEAGISKKVEPNASLPIRLLRGTALAILGRRQEAQELLSSLREIDTARDPWTDFYLEFLKSLLTVDPNDHTRARQAFRGLARFKNGRSREITMMSIYVAFGMGEPAAELLALTEEIGAAGTSVVGDIVEELLRAETAHDAYRLDAVGERFEQRGMRERAAAAFELAATAHLAAGRKAEASLSHARRDAQRSDAIETPKPASKPNVSHEKIAKLTRRELEIAQLAGLGLSNSEIATRLFLSVRTVESHVLQARVKLGAGRRSELGQYLAEFDHRAS